MGEGLGDGREKGRDGRRGEGNLSQHRIPGSRVWGCSSPEAVSNLGLMVS